MKVIDEKRFEALVAAGEIGQRGCHFLDGLKIGLRIKTGGRILPAVVDASPGKPILTDEPIHNERTLTAGEFYLFETVERISLPSSIFGFLHTRSSVARLGIGCVGSSYYVAPGFGQGVPRRLVLEVSSMRTVINLPLEEPMAGLVLFEAPTPLRVGDRPFNGFPFNGA